MNMKKCEMDSAPFLLINLNKIHYIYLPQKVTKHVNQAACVQQTEQQRLKKVIKQYSKL